MINFPARTLFASVVSLGCSAVALSAFGSESASGDARPAIEAVSAERSLLLDTQFAQLLTEHGVHTAGVGIIKNGQLVWAGYYGEQSPGKPASERTQFNIASITKTVTSETILRLAGQGLIDLDEPMASHWIEDDIADDPRTMAMTPRMALTHSTGLPNWRILDDQTGAYNPELKLRFLFEPGTSYSYSGEGFQYLARFVEHKLDADFEELVQSTVYEPTGMTNVSLSRREANLDNIVWTYDREGNFNGHYCRPGGYVCAQDGDWSAAGNMRVTVADHARFMRSVMDHDGYSNQMAADRNTVHVEQWNRPHTIWIKCEALPESQCPEVQGYGLGWKIADYGDHQLVGHDGSDHSEVSLAYFYSDTRDGIVIFLNAPNRNGSAMLPEAIKLLHPGSPVIPFYER